MTREELREYVEELESQGEIPYHVYSNLIDCIDTLEQEPRKDEVILTKEEYGKLVSSEYDNGYAKGYREALEQEPTTKNNLEVDAISKAEVNQVIEDYMDEQYHVLSDRTRERAFGAKVVMARINELPSVTPQEPRWIPTSEKLPNDRDWYLGIFKEPDTGWINPLPFICDYVGSETKATTKEHWILRGFTDMDEHIDYYFNLECVAWMPLPKTYSEVEE